ncbi:MAG TPA: penicillin acylase family protein [Gemmatimonadaceae bacterium]|nr:penicillin acylase family protein [Gemmatimonadaceae bacterium]
MSRPLRILAAAVPLAALLYVGSRPVGPLPPLGPLLSPASGVWALAGVAQRPGASSATIRGLGDAVEVRYDDRGVPHIFARTPDDAYRALGYVVAQDRLFQLELQARAAAGTLTELLGARLVDADRETRARGMPRAAQQKLAALDPTSRSARALRAYAEGINAYLDAMPAAALPLEYRLLGTAPSRWAPINSVHLLNRMAQTLSFQTEDLERERAVALVGRAATDALWPRDNPVQEPVQPVPGRAAPVMDLSPLPPPGRPDGDALLTAVAGSSLGRSVRTDVLAGQDVAVGSNNWAVAPRRTAAGRAILAGDPHLDLTLPSIWYEVHIVVPGELDVAGVTLPGAPWVVIGFNRDVAWSLTNAQTDAVDFYREQVDDATHPASYRMDATWRPVERRVDTLRAPRGVVAAVDTLYFTHRGPLTRVGDVWVSMRWLALEAHDDLDVFERAMRARSAEEWLAGYATFAGPAQNTLVADRGGHIAIRATGLVPIRPGGGAGDAIRDGSTAASDWTGFLPAGRYPGATDPAQGFLASANQQPVDPHVSPVYFGRDYPAPWRAMRINALLRADSSVTPDEMRAFQTDPGSVRAELFTVALLDAARRRDLAGRDARLGRAAALLAAWDRRYQPDDTLAVLFEAAMEELTERTWDELRAPGGARVLTPGGATLYRLLADPASAWWDDRGTPARETRDEILVASLSAALDTVTRTRGPPGRGWRWGDARPARIGHLLRIPALSAPPLAVRGGPGTLNPSGPNGFGSSWRMVVELGPVVRAWATYPGGQSGHPGAAAYDDRLSLWRQGALAPVALPRTPDELASDRTRSRLRLVGEP